MTNELDDTNAPKQATSCFERIAQESQQGKKLRQPFNVARLPPLWPFVVVAVMLVVVWGVLFLNAPPTKGNWHFQFCDRAHGGIKNICSQSGP